MYETTRSPGTAGVDTTVGTFTWANPDNAKVLDSVYTEADSGGQAIGTYLSYYLKLSNFGFTLPDNAIITGIMVEINRSDLQEQMPIYDNEVRIQKPSSAICPDDNAKAEVWPHAFSYLEYGGAGDLWGDSFIASQINDSDFAVLLSIKTVISSPGELGIASVDHVRVTIYWELPTETSYITWQMLNRNQVDSELIEEAVDRIVAQHNANPEAHLGTGEALQSHKAEVIIDHVAGSVLADKMSNSESFLNCNFESFDFWATYGNTDYESIGLAAIITVDDDPLTSGFYSSLFSSGDIIDWTKNLMVQFSFWLDSAIFGTAVLGLTGYYQTSQVKGFGFMVENGSLKGYWGNGTTLTKTAGLGISTYSEHVYRAYYDAFLQNVKYYVDGVYVATIENISPATLTNVYIEFYLNTDVDKGNEMLVRNLIFSRGF